MRPRAPLVADGDVDLGRLPAREDGERRVRVGDLAAERLRRLVRALGDRAAHAGAGDVGEPRLARARRPRAVAGAAEVDPPRPPVAGDGDRLLELARDAVGADEVPAGAARDHGELDASSAGEAVDDLVHRAVAADATISFAPRSAASRASRPSWPGPVGEQRVAGQAERRGLVRELGPAPPGGAVLGGRVDEEDGLCSVVVGRGRERDAGHAVDGGAQLVVGDPRELALDDDVADGEQAGGLDVAQGAEREEDGGLHLDGEDAAARPALVLAAVRVVEDVAGHDRPDVHRLADLLRRVHGRVHELPVGGRAVRLAHVRVDGAVCGDGRERDDQVAERRCGCSPPQVPTRMMRFTPSWTSSSITIAADGQPMPLDWTEIGLPSKVPV